jgi:hypothetical protein
MIAERAEAEVKASAAPAEQTPEQRTAAARKRRADRELDTAKARAAQEAIDLEAIEKLELAGGYMMNVENQVTQHVPGHPVIIGIRPPTEAEYKRFFSQVHRANGNGDAKAAATVMLAQSCWAYPEDPASRAALIAQNAALLASVSAVANKLAELKQDEAGKG